MIFSDFSYFFLIAGNNGKYINLYYNEKKKSVQKPFWATAQIIL